MMIEPRTLKGFRDFLPHELQKREYVTKILKDVFVLYGFAPLETPTLEYEDILLGKYGDEGDKLMYRFKDNGDRSVALRYDQTVPLARVVAQHRNDIIFPFKRYQIQNVFRADNTQRGRFREFLQCDIDTVGTSSELADIEIIRLITDAFKRLGFSDFSILLNDRSLFDNIPREGIQIIDKLKKIGKEHVVAELVEKGIDPSLLDGLMDSDIPDKIQRILTSTTNTSFDPTLARGLDYYTSTIIEVELKNYTAGSLGGGGRYDTLIGMFMHEAIPAVGFAFGFDRILDAMEQLHLFPSTLSEKNVLVTVFNAESLEYSMKIISHLRERNIPSDMYLDPESKIDKQLKYADRNNFTYAVIAGPEEIQNSSAILKNLKNHSQETFHITELANAITVQPKETS